MEEKVLYSMESPFQQEINVKGYYFGKNEGKEHSACIVGALRGNEYQQLYICSKLIDVLKKIEKYFTIKALIKLYTKYKETAALRACQRFYVSGSYKRRKLCVYVHLQR